MWQSVYLEFIHSSGSSKVLLSVHAFCYFKTAQIASSAALMIWWSFERYISSTFYSGLLVPVRLSLGPASSFAAFKKLFLKNYFLGKFLKLKPGRNYWTSEYDPIHPSERLLFCHSSQRACFVLVTDTVRMKTRSSTSPLLFILFLIISISSPARPCSSLNLSEKWLKKRRASRTKDVGHFQKFFTHHSSDTSWCLSSLL